MSRFSQVKDFEEKKIQEIKEQEEILRRTSQQFEKDSLQKIQSLSAELSPYREKLRNENALSLKKEMDEFSKIIENQVAKLSSAGESTDEYARQIAYMILK